MKRSCLVLALLLGSAKLTLAQVQGGTISGIVLDEQRAVLPGVAVTLQGVDATRESTTEADGRFRFLDLAPGPYKLTLALSGFSTIVHDEITVAVGKTVDLPLTMKIASVAETITVSGESPIVDTKAARLSTSRPTS
jgi:hypothetical protein